MPGTCPEPRSVASWASGVGQSCAAPGRPARAFGVIAPRFSESFARAVGQDEDSRSLVGGTHLGSAKHRPLDIEPEAGQVPQNRSESGSSRGREQSPHVFQKNESRPNSANDVCNGVPDPTLVLDTFTLSRGAVGLTGEPSGDPLNSISKLLGREGFE